jgi:hypothetical protein
MTTEAEKELMENMDCGVPEEFLQQLEDEFGPRNAVLAERFEVPEKTIEVFGLMAAVASGWPIPKECSNEYTALHHSGVRNNNSVKWIVIHCTQSHSAEAAARWFENPNSSGSAHVCTDAIECYRTLAPKYIPWAAPGANSKGWHLEIAGFAQWTRTQWLARTNLLNRSAYKAAVHAKFYGIPVRLLTVPQLKAGNMDGFVTHKRCSDAFGGTHYDPGTGFPLDWFMNRIRYYRARV